MCTGHVTACFGHAVHYQYSQMLLHSLKQLHRMPSCQHSIISPLLVGIHGISPEFFITSNEKCSGTYRYTYIIVLLELSLGQGGCALGLFKAVSTLPFRGILSLLSRFLLTRDYQSWKKLYIRCVKKKKVSCCHLSFYFSSFEWEGASLLYWSFAVVFLWTTHVCSFVPFISRYLLN